MNCLEFRRQTMENPGDRDPARLRHRLACPSCADWAQRQAAFDARLADALSVEIPEGLRESVLMHTHWSRRKRFWPGIAAGVLVFIGAGLASWQWLSTGPLPGEVIAHLYHEPELLLDAETEVDPVRLHQVLTRIGVRLDGDIGQVTHAGLCEVAGRLAAHLVVAGEHGPVAVLVMPRRGVGHEMPVADASLQGAIVPVGRGSIAVIGFRGESTGEIAERMRRSFIVES